MRPPWPYRLPRGGRRDGCARLQGETLIRLLHIDDSPVVVRVWQRRSGEVRFRAGGGCPERRERAVERMRFALGVDDDLSGFHAEFRSDPLIGPAIRRRPWLRPKRRPFAWEPLVWAITEQLIESSRAAEIQRRMVRRWGRRIDAWQGRGPLRDVPQPSQIAALAPVELQAMDLAAGRALAMVRCAKEVVAGRIDPAQREGDARLLRIPEIGPWTVQCLGLLGRGDQDSLPAGDLAYVKLVGVLARLGRRATVPEIEAFYAPYEPYRGLAGLFSLSNNAEAISLARGLPLAPLAEAA